MGLEAFGFNEEKEKIKKKAGTDVSFAFHRSEAEYVEDRITQILGMWTRAQGRRKLPSMKEER